MKATVVVYIVVTAFFCLIVGYLIGVQQAAQRPGSAVAPAAAAAPAQPAAAPADAARPVDESQVSSLRADAGRDANDPKPRAALGNLYYDAHQYQEAVKWYEEAIKLDPKDINVSTDLGASYWALNQPDQALQQFDHSLSLDPRHATTLLNQGIVRAFGKQDLQGAIESWEKVIQAAPDSEQARSAKRMLDGLKQAHPEVGAAAQPAGRGGR